MRTKKPFIVSWSPDYLKLSDGSTRKEFFDHDEAFRFLEEEIAKVEFPHSTRVAREEYRNTNGVEPKQAQLECTREVRGVCLLYGVSDRYIVPSKESL